MQHSGEIVVDKKHRELSNRAPDGAAFDYSAPPRHRHSVLPVQRFQIDVAKHILLSGCGRNVQ